MFIECVARIAFATVGTALAMAEAASVFAAPPSVSPDLGPKADDFIDEVFATGKYASLSAGIVTPEELVWSRAVGVADAETSRPAELGTLYRMGSVTKVFTSTLLAQLCEDGTVQLDDPVLKYLPQGSRLPTDPNGLPTITLRHLSTHTSGLTAIPSNLVAKGSDPYGGYSEAQLLNYLAGAELTSPTGTAFGYSNLGVGLLGYALARAANSNYEDAITARILQPLGMNDSGFTLSEQSRARYAIGYRDGGAKDAATEWDLGVLSPAGALISNVPDMAKFLQFQFTAGGPAGEPLGGAWLAETHRVQFLEPSWESGIGLGWVVNHDKEFGDIVWHNGAVEGHTSYVGFIPKRRVGVILLTNTAERVDAPGAELLKLAAGIAGSEAPFVPDAAVIVVGERLQAAMSGDPKGDIAELFSEQFLQSVPATAIKAILLSLTAQHGKATSVRYEKWPEAGITKIIWKFENEKEATGLVGFESRNPVKINFLYFPPPGAEK